MTVPKSRETSVVHVYIQQYRGRGQYIHVHVHGVGFFLFFLIFPVWLVCYAHVFHVGMTTNSSDCIANITTPVSTVINGNQYTYIGSNLQWKCLLNVCHFDASSTIVDFRSLFVPSTTCLQRTYTCKSRVVITHYSLCMYVCNDRLNSMQELSTNTHLLFRFL